VRLYGRAAIRGRDGLGHRRGHGREPGTTTIQATVEGRTGTATLRVTPAPPRPVASVTVTLGSASLAPRQTTQATATLRDASGALLAGRVVAWTTSDPGVATVSATGVVTAVAPGTATVTATSEGRTGSAALTVTPPVVASVGVALSAGALQTGQTAVATVTLRAADGELLTGRPVAWASSDGAIANVAADGTVRALGPGRATITATSEGRTGAAVLTVTAPAPVVARIRLAPNTVNLQLDRPERNVATFTAVAYDERGQVVVDAPFRWSLTPSGVVSLTADTRLPGTVVVTGVREGEATLTVSVGGVTENARVRVRDRD
jgi:uncharacterized protein YjdB